MKSHFYPPFLFCVELYNGSWKKKERKERENTKHLFWFFFFKFIMHYVILKVSFYLIAGFTIHNVYSKYNLEVIFISKYTSWNLYISKCIFWMDYEMHKYAQYSKNKVYEQFLLFYYNFYIYSTVHLYCGFDRKVKRHINNVYWQTSKLFRNPWAKV